MLGEELINAICEQNLAVYRASVTRLREDVSQEAEIAHDYQGRIVYELLQNADDAMAGQPTHEDSVWVRLTNTDLWVGNSGRPLDEDDVRGLCGIGASSKGASVGRRRASIGHKGMGFKSVLEITNGPEVFSESFSFRLGREFARVSIEALLEELGEPPPDRVPAMRFPANVATPPAEWEEAKQQGIRTLFRFPLRGDMDQDRRKQLADRLLGLPATAIVFLKHLERIEVQVDVDGRKEKIIWGLTREHQDGTGWVKVPALSVPGVYRITVNSLDSGDRQFLVAHDNSLEIGKSRGALDGYAWEGIELSEVAVAAELVGGKPVALPPESRVLHVFLPTGEPCPYPILVNGAFSADLSRQEVRVSDDSSDYNAWLLGRAAWLFGQSLVPALRELGANDPEILELLDRGVGEPGEPAATNTGQVLTEGMREALSSVNLVSLSSGERVSVDQCVVPTLVQDETCGSRFRELLPEHADFDGLALPDASVCGGRSAFVLVDHGARELTPGESPVALAEGDLGHTRLVEHESGGLYVDPVLSVLEATWDGLPSASRKEFESAVRSALLFPVGVDGNGMIQRVAVGQQDCFYPPRTLSGTIPLQGLCFLSRDVCWGALTPKERKEILRDQMAAWQALFGVRDFKFPDVMRSSVLPALTLVDEGGRAEGREELQTLETLAAVCQLSGRTPNPSSPLPYERLGTNRALFNLSRLPVPCRTDTPERYEWRPAYRVYFGSDWIGDASIERVLEAITETGGTVPEVPLIAPPEALVPLLEKYRHLLGAAEEDADIDEGDDEVDIEEDEEAALDSTDRDRWLSFLCWVGVNRAVRPVHFADVEDSKSGWLTTKDLAKPRGWAFHELPDELWQPFRERVHADLVDRGFQEGSAYFYSVHDLEYIAPLLEAATSDASCAVARAFLGHLVENWTQLQRFARVEVAVVADGLVPSMRTKPPRAQADERHYLGENFWLSRLRQRDFLPTSHGPRSPANTWIRTSELQRRFSSRRGGVDCSQLLPVLSTSDETARRARPLLSSLDTREEITASSFGTEDAKTILGRLERMYEGGPDRAAIREVVRPTYRSLIELLPGQDESGRYEPGCLSNSPLLESNGHDGIRFREAGKVVWAERNGTRERLGNPPDLWTLVHDSSANARLPLTRLFGVRVLEDQLDWAPNPGPEALNGRELTDFREGLFELAPYLLARLSADRPAEQLQRRDASTIGRLVKTLLPVESLEVGCQLDGASVGETAHRAAFVDLRHEGTGTRAFVRWGEHGWPPSPIEAEALATAFADGLGATNFEAFLALINAPDGATRLRILSLAGAPTDLEAARQALFDEGGSREAPKSPVVEIPPEPGEAVDETPASPPKPEQAEVLAPATPLYSPDQLLVDGTPVSLTGVRGNARNPAPKDSSPRKPGSDGNRGGYGGRTDLGVLDHLGMFIAMTFERNRLRNAGLSKAEVFDPGSDDDQPHAFVFDISSPELITVATEHSSSFARAMTYLVKHGVDSRHPGCDILTVSADQSSPVDRMIELKSSGVHSRTQAMTWNEWKTAQSPDLRSHFYLYLAGNLRSDLPDARPFLRTVRDPYESMSSEEHEEETRSRKVVLYVSEFDEAEELTLGITGSGQSSSSGSTI